MNSFRPEQYPESRVSSHEEDLKALARQKADAETARRGYVLLLSIVAPQVFKPGTRLPWLEEDGSLSSREVVEATPGFCYITILDPGPVVITFEELVKTYPMTAMMVCLKIWDFFSKDQGGGGK